MYSVKRKNRSSLLKKRRRLMLNKELRGEGGDNDGEGRGE